MDRLLLCDRSMTSSEPIPRQDIETQSIDELNIEQQFIFCIEVRAVAFRLLLNCFKYTINLTECADRHSLEAACIFSLKRSLQNITTFCPHLHRNVITFTIALPFRNCKYFQIIQQIKAVIVTIKRECRAFSRMLVQARSFMTVIYNGKR